VLQITSPHLIRTALPWREPIGHVGNGSGVYANLMEAYVPVQKRASSFFLTSIQLGGTPSSKKGGMEYHGCSTLFLRYYTPFRPPWRAPWVGNYGE
jgi:hypothetical protein